MDTDDWQSGQAPCWNNLVNYVRQSRLSSTMPVAGLINAICPCLTPDLFMFSKQYKVVKSVDRAQGKWSQSLGNSFFIDSEWLLPDLVDMLEDHLRKIF